MPVRTEKVRISDLLDNDGNPFNHNQALSYTEERWKYPMKGCLQYISYAVNDDRTFSDDHWLDILRPLNTLYRVRAILRALRLNHTVPAIGVVEYEPGVFTLKDGRHRCWATILNGEDYILADVTYTE